MEEIDEREFSSIDCCFFMEKIMEKIIFKNDKEKIAMKLAMRKEIVHEIIEDSRCRKCPHFNKYVKNHGVKIEDKRN